MTSLYYALVISSCVVVLRLSRIF